MIVKNGFENIIGCTVNWNEELQRIDIFDV